MNFKKWFESGGGFIGQSMTDPFDDRPPSGSEITVYTSLDGSDLPPTKKNRKKEKRKPKFATFGGIRKEIPLNNFI
jgi:hypothetical protein